MKTEKKILTVLTCLVAVLALQACIGGTHMITKAVDPVEVTTGTYTLILYGCRYPDDIENMAILVDEKSGYPFEVDAPKFMYAVKSGLPAPQALREANSFIGCSMHNLWQTALRRIVDNTSKTIGYELKPLYWPWEFKVSEVLQSTYSLKDGKITAYITLDPSARRTKDFRDHNDFPRKH